MYSKRKNSLKMFENRMKYRLEDLLKNPDSYTSYKNRYNKFIENSNHYTPWKLMQ